MIDDFARPPRRKPKVIEPMPKEDRPPLPDLDAVPEDTSFRTPEEVATEDSTIDDTAVDSQETDPPQKEESPEDTSSHHKHRWPFNKKQTIIGAVVAVLLIGGGAAAYIANRPAVKGGVSTSKKADKKPAKSTTVASTLTGLQVDPSVNQRPVTGVMIENSLDARPQSGLDQAGVVFEAVAEGGVTRFLALFQDSQPDYIGPVRSARPYYVQWCMSFDCSYAHVGGSPDALADITAWGTKDLNQFFNAGAYQRISSRYAPHNVYTSIDQLNQLEASKGFGASSYTGFARKTDKPYKAPTPATANTPAKVNDSRTPATSIDFSLSGYYYNPHFDYDAATNSYKRGEAGAPHMELHKDGMQSQITPKVVIGMVVPKSQGTLDSSGAYYSDYAAVGSGQVYIFQDGTVITGTWSKPDIKSSISLTDDAGKPIQLNAGQTWITAIQSGGASYK